MKAIQILVEVEVERRVDELVEKRINELFENKIEPTVKKRGLTTKRRPVVKTGNPLLDDVLNETVNDIQSGREPIEESYDPLTDYRSILNKEVFGTGDMGLLGYTPNATERGLDGSVLDTSTQTGAAVMANLNKDYSSFMKLVDKKSKGEL